VVGFRGQGNLHIRLLQELPGVRVVALCDADRDVLGRGVKAFADRNRTVAGFTDVRQLLESKEVDAITTATPDHWHALVVGGPARAVRSRVIPSGISS
jgi:predicted dehydrogenase